jgi:hypothetical protein
MHALDSETGEHDRAPRTFASGDLPGELVDSWGLLRQLHIAVAQEQRHVTTLALDLGMLSRLVRQTDSNVVWTVQALDAAQRQAAQAQALSGGTNAEPVDGAPGRQGPPSTARRAPLPTRPLEMDARLSDSGRLLYPEAPSSATPAPGSIRVQDLFGSGGGHASGPLDGTAPDKPTSGAR